MMAGSMDNWLIFQRPVETQDEVGGSAVTWSAEFATWGDVRSLRAAERYDAGQRGQTITHQVMIRHRAGITPDMRIKTDDGRYLYIIGLPIEMRRISITLECEERYRGD